MTYSFMGETIDLGVMVSHGGSNLQAIIDACQNGTLDARVRVVISNNSLSKALRRARKSDIPAIHLSSVTHPDKNELDKAITSTMVHNKVQLVVLAGYMRKLGETMLQAYPNRIINSHPSLLPLHGGFSMYGDLVHEEVITQRDRESGITIHIVDEEYDHGPVVSQVRVLVNAEDSIDSLRDRIQSKEHGFWIETLNKIQSGEIDLDKLKETRNPHLDE